mgnify:CR=1 FL=1
MGAGIAQVAATAGHPVILYDNSREALEKAVDKLAKIFARLVEKGRIEHDEAEIILDRIETVDNITAFHDCDLVIEAIIENLEIKQSLFENLEGIISDDCILASNTSSLSITSIAGECKKSARVIGIHFFNPAPLMPLVEIIPALQTSEEVINNARELNDGWKKTTVIAKDTPGFIVNRVARPFYGEALRIYEEGMADFATIDWAMKELGGFRMGPFTLMDYIGNDVNYAVTETVFKEFFYDPRYKPSFTQKRMVEAKRLGRKSGHGYYDYAEHADNSKPKKNETLGNQIVNRIVCMLINEAADALFLNIATREDLDLAMTKGVNYPKGLLKWADEIGIPKVLSELESLHEEYGEDRYRPSPLLKKMVAKDQTFYQ